MAKKVNTIKKDTELVKGVFRNLENPERDLKFTYNVDGKKTEKWHFIPGEVRTIPKYIAKHLKEGCSYVVHEGTIDSLGRPSGEIGKVRYRFAFENLDYSYAEKEDNETL